jgi:hydrogenase maturation protein HypF
MAENGLGESHRVIGVAFDGTGFGDDGAIWGGEFLVADYFGYQRAAHLSYFPLPGGDVSIRRPSRTALSLLYSLGMEWDDSLATHADLCADDRSALRAQLEHKINSPLTSSIGRLFDAAAALAGVRQQINYEAQAAIEFEALVDPDELGIYEFEYSLGLINPKPALESLLADVYAGVTLGKISGKFHNGLARMVGEVCNKISDEYDLSEVALSGGVWQNMTLLNKTVNVLEKDGFTVYIHRQLPTNDGGLALGQAVVAAQHLKR